MLIDAAGDGGAGAEVRDMLMSSNSILENFGNAKTLRNNNSSRFGKWMAIRFDEKYKLLGANVINYLLEKSRITEQGKGERNYHIFYSLVKSSAKYPYTKRLGLSTDCKKYPVLFGGGCDTVSTINDEQEFDDVINAFKIFKFADETRDDILSCLAAMLHAAAIQFGDGKVKNKNISDLASKLFGWKPATYEKMITNKTISVMGNEVSTPLKAKKCVSAALGLNKDIYNRCFDFLVQQINKELIPSVDPSKLPMIGVLDIFGFEIFEVNLFEQFCINVTNERLQNYFQRYCWEREKSVYESEGITVEAVSFQNNDPCIALFENKKNGIFRLIQDETALPNGNDQTLAVKMHKEHKKNANYRKVKYQTQQFQIVHFAGTVTYEINGFFAKNLDAISEVTQKAMATSSNKLVALLYKPPKEGGKKQSKSKCLGTAYLKSLKQLIKSMDATTPHFIRCVKPNESKKPGEWDHDKTFEQLKFSGVFAYLALRRCGYAVQMDFKEWATTVVDALTVAEGFEKFKAMIESDPRGACDGMAPILAGKYKLKSTDFQFGKTKIFMKNAKFSNMEMEAERVREERRIEAERIRREEAERKAREKAEAAAARAAQGLPPEDDPDDEEGEVVDLGPPPKSQEEIRREKRQERENWAMRSSLFDLSEYM